MCALSATGETAQKREKSTAEAKRCTTKRQKITTTTYCDVRDPSVHFRTGCRKALRAEESQRKKGSTVAHKGSVRRIPGSTTQRQHHTKTCAVVLRRASHKRKEYICAALGTGRVDEMAGRQAVRLGGGWRGGGTEEACQTRMEEYTTLRCGGSVRGVSVSLCVCALYLWSFLPSFVPSFVRSPIRSVQ